MPGEHRARLWVLMVAGLCMFPLAAFFYFQGDLPAVFVNLLGGVAVIGYSAYRLSRT